MSKMKEYDAIIIGSGQGGGPLAGAMAQQRWKTVLVEREHVGGTCINEGCTPTKTMIASARVAHILRRASDYGIKTGPMHMDMNKVRQRKRDIVDSFRSGSEKRIENTKNLELIKGEAQFSGPKSVHIQLRDGGREDITADTIIINTGTRPSIPDIKKIDTVPFLTSTTIMELDRVPRHLLVLGGGYIGLEFGQMFSRFGSMISIVHRREQLLTREDPDIAAEILKIFQDDDIKVHLNTNPLSIEKKKNGLELILKNSKKEFSIEGTHLLVAAGRIPNSDTLHLDTTGIEVDKRGFIRVNEKLETTAEGIYAIGDVKGGPAFTHISYDDFRILNTNLLKGGNATTENRIVPYTVFIDPQLGRVGLNEREAQAINKKYGIAKLPMAWVARALEVDESRGFMKAIIDTDTEQILGCSILGIEGGEIAAVIQMAMMGRIPYPEIRDTVFSHPTLAESLNNLFANIELQS